MGQIATGAPRRIHQGLIAAAVLALGLYGAPAVAQDSAAVVRDTAAYAPRNAAEAQGQVSVELLPVASSGISGTVVLAADDGDTDIEITLATTGDEEREYDVTLRKGTCAEPGEVVQRIDDTESDGEPEDEDTDIQLAAILAAPHIIHVAQEGGDAAVACGEIGAK